MHGGTETNSIKPINIKGLSPHARGNPKRRVLCRDSSGSIPACTGEPPCNTYRECFKWVYPRMHGGTDRAQPGTLAIVGLSPHARGNQQHKFNGGNLVGSIPACTGEPIFNRPLLRTLKVYPRMHGGTSHVFGIGGDGPGLSPHARGNL